MKSFIKNTAICILGSIAAVSLYGTLVLTIGRKEAKKQYQIAAERIKAAQ